MRETTQWSGVLSPTTQQRKAIKTHYFLTPNLATKCSSGRLTPSLDYMENPLDSLSEPNTTSKANQLGAPPIVRGRGSVLFRWLQMPALLRDTEAGKESQQKRLTYYERPSLGSFIHLVIPTDLILLIFLPLPGATNGSRWNQLEELSHSKCPGPLSRRHQGGWVGGAS